jgi:hypothetical protein
MKSIENLLEFECPEEELENYLATDDRLKEVFRVLCILLNQWGFKPVVFEVEERMMRVLIKTKIRTARRKNACMQICRSLNTIFDWIPYEMSANYVDECYGKKHFKLTVPKPFLGFESKVEIKDTE